MVGVSSIGQLWAPIRETAPASRVTALSVLIWDPWPARPWATRRSQDEALLGRLQQIGALAADGGGKAADLGDRFRGALKEFGPLVDGVAGAVCAAGFLIGEEREDEVSLGFAARAGEVAQHGKNHGVHVLHVHGAASPDQAVLQFGAEGVHRPLVAEGRDHVQVAVDHQGAGGGVLAGQPGHHAGAAGGDSKISASQPDFSHEPGGVFGGRPLPRPEPSP